MNMSDARTWQSRLLARTATDPTASARALRAVINQHQPTTPRDLPGPVMCEACRSGTGWDGFATAYPCATLQTVALELVIPLPVAPAYDGLLDA